VFHGRNNVTRFEQDHLVPRHHFHLPLSHIGRYAQLARDNGEVFLHDLNRNHDGSAAAMNVQKVYGLLLLDGLVLIVRIYENVRIEKSKIVTGAHALLRG
jgi:hypothetical protein